MSHKSELTLADWTGRDGDGRDGRHEWTRNKIREVLRAGPLVFRDIDVDAKGSYPNHTYEELL
jgi:hypothetical protein